MRFAAIAVAAVLAAACSGASGATDDAGDGNVAVATAVAPEVTVTEPVVVPGTSGRDSVPTSTDVGSVPPADCPVDAEVAFVCGLRAAAELVDVARGGPQEYFEITANAQAVSVFVAIDDATAAVPYLVIDGVVELLGDPIDGASGNTFVTSSIEYDPAAIVAGASAALPTARFVALSVEGGPNGAVRYVMATETGAVSVALDGDGTVLAAVD